MSGLVQAIVCNEEHTLACHMIQGTLCELMHSCGDTRERFSACKYKMEVSSLFYRLVGDFNDIWAMMVGLIIMISLYLVIVHPMTSKADEIEWEFKQALTKAKKAWCTVRLQQYGGGFSTAIHQSLGLLEMKRMYQTLDWFITHYLVFVCTVHFKIHFFAVTTSLAFVFLHVGESHIQNIGMR